MLLLAAIAAIILLAQRAASTDAPAEPAGFTPPTSPQPMVADVQGAEGGKLSLRIGDATIEIEAPAQAPVEVLEPITPAEIAVGAWIQVIGVPNEVKNFSIRLLVVFPTPTAPGEGGVVRSALGFGGYEAERDAHEGPVLGGTVESVAGQQIRLRAAIGPVDLSVSPGVPLRRLRPGTVEEIRAGDRIAVRGSQGGKPDLATGTLVLAGGAR